MTRFAIPLHARTMALSLSNDAATVKLAQTDASGLAALELALTASQRMRRGAAAMETELKRQIANAKASERDRARVVAKAERANEAILQARGVMA